jgi:hypothetical protein
MLVYLCIKLYFQEFHTANGPDQARRWTLIQSHVFTQFVPFREENPASGEVLVLERLARRHCNPLDLGMEGTKWEITRLCDSNRVWLLRRQPMVLEF